MALGLVMELRPTHFSFGNHFFEYGWLGLSERDEFPRRLAASYRFVCVPYFRRVWVVQELSAARRPHIICGKDFVVEWQSLDHATWGLLDILYSDTNLVEKIYAADPDLEDVPPGELSFARRPFYLRNLRQGILDVIALYRDFQSTVPQDKGFALINLATDMDRMDFTPDHTKGLAQTRLEFALAVAKKSVSSDITCAAEPVVADGLIVPSWCPDWSTPPTTVSNMIRRIYVPDHFDEIHAPYRWTNPRFSFNGSILDCAGIILDTVRHIGPFDPSETILGEQPIWKDWMEMAAGALQTVEDAALLILEQKFQARFWGMLSGSFEGGTHELRTRVPGWSGEQDALTKNKGRDVYVVVTNGRCFHY
ncbi:uncharacterized protein RAG0_02385 [Rhynchosporium agropyri]|uniref:Heterokaryon incompatibility domain-containing protein n=1 Tax=Rhynchosporium agropyri TaxID=914238 RepID=A0A1E1K1G0_9HELO|nr:uncharacterized protein RAG0_02385 [Rhynchosporium agropyri]